MNMRCLVQIFRLLLALMSCSVINSAAVPLSQRSYEIRLLNSHGPCDFIGLIRCFVSALDDWAWSLWNIKDNIAMVGGEACQNHRSLGNCVFYEGCSRMEILEASSLVSDLLAHQKGAGSFLKSYFLADFSCSEEGQVIVNSHRNCLLKQHIGDQAIEASTFVEQQLEKMAQNNTEDPFKQCELLKERAQLMYRIGEDECPPAGGLLMCRSLIDSFIYMYPNKFEFCDVTCAVPTSTSLPSYLDELPSVDRGNDEGVAFIHGEEMELNHKPNHAATLHITPLLGANLCLLFMIIQL
ncbi:hypothetical protein T10_11727 [Trichinella papuae]|uniref:Uncharacterized protein n=1 Tax=Trichinella papuae TaxID=268474 RepID=A0A0V1N1I2_9BILA|nr:hypothetical protein T10_11727 [Trichinella papuae]